MITLRDGHDAIANSGERQRVERLRSLACARAPIAASGARLSHLWRLRRGMSPMEIGATLRARRNP